MMNESNIRKQMSKTIEHFNETQLSKRLALFINQNFREIDCKQIVAFGGTSLGYSKYAPNQGDRGGYDELPLKLQTQHAALLKMQTQLRNLHKGDVPIFLQDPDYTEEDQKAAKELGMTIVNGHFGFEEGWIQIDESTLVVDLHTSFPPLLQLTFEISRPAGILTVFPYEVGMLRAHDKVFAPFSYTIFNWDDEPKPIIVPGMGV
jgi:hypothetical protein